MHYRKLNNKDGKMIEDIIEKRIGGSKGKILSAKGRLVLINSVLSSLPLLTLSFFGVSRGVLKKIDYYGSKFFW